MACTECVKPLTTTINTESESAGLNLMSVGAGYQGEWRHSSRACSVTGKS